ncbi:histone-lysine N-methyltransferase EHMT2 [Parasteatoda tepidariorum]|nr:histone-lysine N-methyltransferase EHMT2 [Parasteatoda tepidariorum]
MASTPSNSPAIKNASKDDSGTSKEEQSGSVSNSHKITTFFPVLRGEGRAKMCASKPGDGKQKEILQKLKSKEGVSLRGKSQELKSTAEQSQKSELISQAKEKLQGNIMSALKTPLGQVLRKNIKSNEAKKDQVTEDGKTSNKSESEKNITKKDAVSENPAERLRSNQRAKKSFAESESSRPLRRLQKQPTHAAKSAPSSLRSGLRKTSDNNQSAALSDKRKDVSEANEVSSNKSLQSVSRQLTFSNTTSIVSSSPVDDADNSNLNQSNNSSGKLKKKKKRFFRGGTYGLYLSKKKRKIIKSNDESKDDNCSLAGTENSSYLDSDEGNSMMSEDLYSASEKSLADDDHNVDSRNSPVPVSVETIESKQDVTSTDADKKLNEVKEQEENTSRSKNADENVSQPAETVAKQEENIDQQDENTIQQRVDNIQQDEDNVEQDEDNVQQDENTEQSCELDENKPESAIVSECSESIQNVADVLESLDQMQWDDSNNANSEKQFLSETPKTMQYDDISNESFSNSVFPSKESPGENSSEKTKVLSPVSVKEEQTTDELNDSEKMDSSSSMGKINDSSKDIAENMDIDQDDQSDQDEKMTDGFKSGDEQDSAVKSGDEQDSNNKSGDEQDNNFKSGDEQDNALKSGDEQDSEGVFSPSESPEKDSDAQSTIATCVKSRQRIKRRFTDDIVDTEVGLLSLNPMPAPRKVPVPKPDPPKDVIETFQPITHSEAKKGPITKIDIIFNSRQSPVMNCTCEGDTYEANLGSEEEGVFCQAVDSIDDKLVGCSNPVVTNKLVRTSVKIPFTIMCEMHLWRLKHHHSCPYCGLFCSQGSFIQCVTFKNKRRVVHLYHEQCQSKEEGIGTFCLHCGATSGLKHVTLEMHMASPPSFFLSQLTNQPLPHVEKARISISNAVERMKDDEVVDFSYRIEDTGKVLSSVGLKNGPEKDELDKLLQMMNENRDIPNYHTHEEFYTASAEGDLLKVLNILARGIDPNLKFSDHEDDTALHAAAANGQTTVVHLLIQAGAINDSLNERTYTPLMLAVENNHKDVVFYLIKNGALADFKGENGMSSFHMAAKNGNLDILKMLMSSRNVDINAQDDGGWTPIVWASEHDHYEVVKYLLKRGANPNIKDSEGNTGLHWSAFSGSVDISYLYLDYGCDINARNERGDTPLHIAARQDALACVTLFLSRGADVQIRNKNNQLPAECVIDKTSDTHLSLSLNMLLKKIAGKYQHRSEKILSKDISRGKEQIAIPCVNEVDDEGPPLDFLYVTENCETTPLNIDRTITSLQSCSCEDDCSSSNCVCSSISYQCWYDKDGLLLPNFNLVDPPMLFECNRACSCWALSCRNRVVQNGITCRLQLIRTRGKGWGVRTLKDIPKGTFICEYVGEMISDSAADKRADDSYLFDLDNRDGETYCLDARYYGNISRFINHLCEPNLVPVKMYVDHQDLNFPRIAFFSSRDIKQYEELGFDYCEKFWVIKYKYFTCDCGSSKCKYSKDTIHHTLANYYRRVKEEQQLEEGTLQPPITAES